MTVHANASLASVTVQGRSIPVVLRAQCRVCRSSQRLLIEDGLVRGLPPTEIVRRLDEPHGISTRNIREHHRRGHLPVDHDAVVMHRKLLASGEASRLASDATTWQIEQLVEHSAVLSAVHARLASGELSATLRDGLRAARLLFEFDRHTEGLAVARQQAALVEADRMEALARVLELVRTIAGEEVLDAVVRQALDDSRVGLLLLDKRLRRVWSTP